MRIGPRADRKDTARRVERPGPREGPARRPAPSGAGSPARTQGGRTTKTLRRLVPYFRRYPRAFLLGTVALVLTNALALWVPWITKNGIDALHNHPTRADLFRFAGLIVLASLFSGIFRYVMRWELIGLSRKIELDLRNDFFRHLERLSPSYFGRTSTGDLMARATNDVNAVRNFLGPGVMYSMNTAITLVAALALMFVISTRLTLWALLPLPLLSIAVNRLSGLVHRRYEKVQEQFSDMTSFAQETIAGVRVVRAYAIEPYVERRFEDQNREYIRRNLALVRVQGVFYPAISLLAGIGIVLVLLIGGREVIAGRISIGDFVAFNSYLAMLTWPMIALGWVLNLIQRAETSMQRIAAILDEAPEIRSPENARRVPKLRGEIEFRGVRFRYPGAAHDALQGIDLAIPAGKTVAIVGKTGSGKTSLVHLVGRLYDATEGQVLVDGVDVREMALDDLRRAIGLVPQETFLFSKTISENISFGQEAELDEIRNASDIAQLTENVLGFPRGFETLVGERGVTLSGGQKQRTAIARALLRNPAILILDDALSSVDTETEERILSRLREVLHRRTSLIVSHRISTVRDADRIVVLEEGRIAESGTHEDLLERDGLYAELSRLQQLEEELARV